MEGARSQCVVFLSHAGPNLHLAVLSATTFGLWQQLDHLPLLLATTSPYNSRHGRVAAIRKVVYIIAQNYNLSRVDLWGEATRGGYGTRLKSAFHGDFDQEEHCLDLIRHDYLTPILGTISQIFRIFRSAIKRYRCWEKKWASVH